MVVAVTALETVITQFGTNGVTGSDQTFNNLLNQIKDGSAGHGLSPQLVDQILRDVEKGPSQGGLTVDQGLTLIDTAEHNGQGGTQGTSNNGTSGSDAGVKALLDEVANHEISPQAAEPKILTALNGQGSGTDGTGQPAGTGPGGTQTTAATGGAEPEDSGGTTTMAGVGGTGIDGVVPHIDLDVAHRQTTQKPDSTHLTSYRSGAGDTSASPSTQTLPEGGVPGQVIPGEDGQLVDSTQSSSQLDA
jgi:hypothetical protein